MAEFYGEDSEEAAGYFEAEFFAGDEMFQLNVEPVGRVDRRRFSPDPLMGFDPTSMEPSEPRPPMLQPPILASTGGRIPLIKFASRPGDKNVLSEEYRKSLLREDSQMDELPEQDQGVWGRLGRSSSPNIMGNVCGEICGEVCDGRCRTNHGGPFGTLAAEV